MIYAIAIITFSLGWAAHKLYTFHREQFMIPRAQRGSWLAAIRGRIARAKTEREEAEENERRLRRPVYLGVLTGNTKTIDATPPFTALTHRWEFYETPLKKRSVKFYGVGTCVRSSDGSDHPLYAMYILPWEKGKIDIDFHSLTKSMGGNIKATMKT